MWELAWAGEESSDDPVFGFGQIPFVLVDLGGVVIVVVVIPVGETLDINIIISYNIFSAREGLRSQEEEEEEEEDEEEGREGGERHCQSRRSWAML